MLHDIKCTEAWNVRAHTVAYYTWGPVNKKCMVLYVLGLEHLDHINAQRCSKRG